MGMAPPQARAYHELQLLSDNDDFSDVKNLASAQINPTPNQVSYLYNIWRKAQFGDRSLESIYQILKNKEEYYKDAGIEIQINESHKNIAIITPIMRRAHGLKFASDIVFVDSTGSCDQNNSVATFFFGSSKVGGIPLGVVFHTGESKHYTNALMSLKNLIGVKGFGGKSEPSIFMTDDSQAERNGLRSCYPNAKLLLSTFRVIQAVWRWLCISSNKIEHNDRKHLIKMFWSVLYCSSEENCNLEMTALLNDKVSMKYNNWLEYVHSLWERRCDWCLCYRTTREKSNNVEYSIRIFKDIVLERCRAFNTAALVDFIATIFEKFHRLRLLEHAMTTIGKPDRSYLKFLKKSSNLEVNKISDNIYIVSSFKDDKSITYHVLSDVGVCECVNGQSGKFCEHLSAVNESFSNILSAPRLRPSNKEKLARLALGEISDNDASVESALGEISDNDASVESALGEISDNDAFVESISDECSEITSDTNQASSSSSSDIIPSEIILRAEDFRIKINEQLEVFSQHCLTAKNIMQSCNQDWALYTILKKFNEVLEEKLSTPANWFAFMENVSKNNMLKRNIKVQPTSITYRKRRLRLQTRGSKRIQAGRISKKENGRIIKKRKKRLGSKYCK